MTVGSINYLKRTVRPIYAGNLFSSKAVSFYVLARTTQMLLLNNISILN